MAVYTIDPFDAQMPFPLDLRYRRGNVTGRDNIPTNARYPGMPCWTDTERVLWILDCEPGQEGSNANWRQVYPASGGSLQTVTWSTAAPTPIQGDDGDIRFRDNASSGNIELWFKVDGSWGMLGEWSKSGGGTISLNNSLDPFGTTSAQLDSAYPNSKGGDMVYNETGFTLWTKLTAGKWTKTSLDIV